MGRRLNGEGCVYKSGNRYIARYQDGWRDNGKPKIRSFSATSKRAAIIRMREFQRRQQELGDNTVVEDLLSDAMKEWLENRKKLELKPSSYDRLCSTFRTHIEPRIGHYTVGSLTANIIQTELIIPLYNKGLSKSSIKKVYQALNNFFEQQILEERLVKNPLRGVALPSGDKFAPGREIRTLSEEEIERFTSKATEMCAGVDKVRYRFGYIYVGMLYCGLRCGEVLGLQWRHLDIQNKRLRVEQNLVYSRGDSEHFGMKLQSPKTKHGIRTVYLNNKAIEYFKKYRDLYYTGDPEGFVITSRDGNLVSTRCFEKYLNYIFDAAGIDARGLHILRHTYCSLMISKGITDLNFLAHQMGHASPELILSTYGHLMPEKARIYEDLLDNL